MCEKWKINPNIDTVSSFALFLSVRGYSCTTAVVHFVISKRRIEFDLFGIDQILIYISLFYLHENMKLWHKFANENAHTF